MLPKVASRQAANADEDWKFTVRKASEIREARVVS